MANNLEKYYNYFTGLDTRSNKLLQPPGSFRRGSKNFRYNFQDEIQNANGFQHKDSSAPTFVDIFEYKYRDVNTGESKTQVLGVATDGHLYRRKQTYLKLVNVGPAASVSIYYDEVGNTFKCDLKNSSGSVLGSVSFNTSVQLKDNPTTNATLIGKINALTGTTGVTASLVDENGNTVNSSTLLAYLLDCVINDTSFANNGVYYWDRVPFADIKCVANYSVNEANLNLNNSFQYTYDSVPFKTTLAVQTDPELAKTYEGISSVNLNNCIYMTDGGFVMKYDSKCVYRAGMPHTNQLNGTFNTYPSNGIAIGWNAGTPTGSSNLANGTYKHKMRYSFTDCYGSTTYGDIIEVTNPVLDPGPPAGNLYAIIDNYGIYNGKDFPVFSAKVNGDQGVLSPSSGPLTLDVFENHNILPGMVIRQIVTVPGTATRATQVSAVSFLAKVTAVTKNTITLEYAACTVGDLSWKATFTNNSIITGYYTQDIYENYVYENNIPIPGASLEIFRTKKDQNGPYYKIYDCEMPRLQTDSVSIIENKLDTQLIELFDDQPIGSEIPRACKYVSQYQGQLVQAGSVQNLSFLNDYYPSIKTPTITTAYCNTIRSLTDKYTLSYACDAQSFYWADVLTPEGFPQDGLHEYAIDTKYNDKLTALSPNKDAFFVFKDRSTAVATGNLAENEIVVEILESDSGCVSHKTVEEVGGYLIWLDQINGFFACVAGRLPVNIGFSIQDYTKINANKLDFKQATAANFRKESLYICSVGTTTFVYDYADNGTSKRNCWYLWDRINGKSVLATADNELLIFDGSITWKMKVTNSKYDFTDHVSAIPMVLNTSWSAQGFPSIDKHYLNLWINSIQGDFTLTVKQYGNFLEDTVASQGNVQFIAETSAKKFIKQPVKAYLPKLSSISFGMENAEKNKWVRIQGYEIQYAADFDTGEPKK